MTQKTAPAFEKASASEDRGGLGETLRAYWNKYNQKARPTISSGFTTLLAFAAMGAFKHS